LLFFLGSESNPNTVRNEVVKNHPVLFKLKPQASSLGLGAGAGVVQNAQTVGQPMGSLNLIRNENQFQQAPVLNTVDQTFLRNFAPSF
jgi:hypothetical protein